MDTGGVRCLIVEDDRDTRNAYRGVLVREFPEMVIEEAADYAAGERAIARGGFNVALVDCNLKQSNSNDFSGIGLARDLTKAGCEVIMISGFGKRDLPEMAETVAGVAMFLSKPVLDTQLRLAVRRAMDVLQQRPLASTALPPGLEHVPGHSRAFLWLGNHVTLTPTCYDLTGRLASSYGQVISHQELLGLLTSGGMDALHSQMKNVRAAFKRVDPRFQFIRCKHGVGYVWEC